VTKREIISLTMREFWNAPDIDETFRFEDIDPCNPTVLALEDALKSIAVDTDILTCSDFGNLAVACCDTCHTMYPHFEMALVYLAGGDAAWVCCAIDRALHPKQAPEADDSSLVDLEDAIRLLSISYRDDNP